MGDTKNNNSFWFRVGGITSIIIAVLIMLLAIYGASKFYHRNDKNATIQSLSSEVINQEFIIKKLKKKVAISQEGYRMSRKEAQKLLRAHKWVEIFRQVMPECIDDSWNEETEKDRGGHIEN